MKCRPISMTMEVPPGTMDIDAFAQAKAYAVQFGCPIHFEFNGAIYVAKPATVERESDEPCTSDQQIADLKEQLLKVGPTGDRFDGHKCTPFHWQITRHRDGRVLSIWHLYPTSKTSKICIDPQHPGPRIEIKNWYNLTLGQCVQAAMNACAKKG